MTGIAVVTVFGRIGLVAIFNICANNNWKLKLSFDSCRFEFGIATTHPLKMSTGEWLLWIFAMLLDSMEVCSDHLDQPASTMEYSLTFGNSVE